MPQMFQVRAPPLAQGIQAYATHKALHQVTQLGDTHRRATRPAEQRSLVPNPQLSPLLQPCVELCYHIEECALNAPSAASDR